MTWKMFRRFFEEGLKKENFFPADGLTNLMEQVIRDAPIVLAYDTFSGSYFEMFGKGRLEGGAWRVTQGRPLPHHRHRHEARHRAVGQ